MGLQKEITDLALAWCTMLAPTMPTMSSFEQRRTLPSFEESQQPFNRMLQQCKHGLMCMMRSGTAFSTEV